MIDYIVVGSGLGGIAFCEQLLDNNCSFMVFDDNSQQSSNIAAGMYNPVIFKRYTSVWKAQEQLDMLHPFYNGLEDKLSVKLNYSQSIYRRFFSIEEQNSWFEAADKPYLQPYLSTVLVKDSIQGIVSDFGFGEVKQGGWVHTNLLQRNYLDYLKSTNSLKEERFDYTKLEIHKDKVVYQGIEAKYIVFSEGFGLHSNPFFNYLPLIGTKGEVLEIEIPGLDLDFILKASVFLLPLGEEKYKVGATYKWKDKTNIPTVASREELEEKLKTFLKRPYKVLNHLAGVRPTVTDRHPLIGQHPEHDRLFVLNGLGSRGVMMAPYLAMLLFDHITNQTPLYPEIDIKRFLKKFRLFSS